MKLTSSSDDPENPGDRGFTLLEVLVVLMVMAIVSTVAARAVGATRSDAVQRACAAERRILTVAIDAFHLETGSVSVAEAYGAPATEGREQTLVDMRYLGAISVLYDVEADGALVPDAGSQC